MRGLARLFLLGVSFLVLPAGHAIDPLTNPRLRRPIALTLVDGGRRLLVANRDSGTIAVLDTQKLQVTAEIQVGRKLSDMALHPNGTWLFVTDEEAGEVIWLAYGQGSVKELRRQPVGISPVSVRITGDGAWATVAGLWPRRLMILDLVNNAQQDHAFVDLPFAPRRQLAVPARAKLIVADAFAGKVAVVDLARRKIDSVRDLAIHNISDLTLSPDEKNVWLTHQILHAQGHTTAGDIRTGNLLTNNIQRLTLRNLVDPVADIGVNDKLYFLGDVELGAGDPAEVIQGPDETILVTLAGVNEVAIGRPEQGLWTRLPVGRRPTALAVDAASNRAYVANTFSDSISVIDSRSPKVIAEISLGPMPPLRTEDRGQMLFFDARLSSESWFSCHSCHPNGHSNGRLNDNFTDGSFGTPKRVLSLLGVKDTGPWAWSGRMAELQTQVKTSLKSTMQGPDPAQHRVEDLTAFLQTLSPPPSLLAARGMVNLEAVQRGRKVFAKEKCALCHAPPTFTSPKTYDVGLRDEVGGTHFNPPSLRGLSQSGPYFHDNRAVTLKEVFTRYKHQLSAKLSGPELSDLLWFLRSL